MPSTRREFPLSDEMKQLGFKRIRVKGKTLFVEHVMGLDPITCIYTDELLTNINGLKQALIDAQFEEKVIDKLLRFISDLWRKQEETSTEEDQGNETKYYVQKYTIGIPPAEAILIEGAKPRFLQIINGKAKLSKEIQLLDITLRPLDRVSYLNKEYSFSSEEIDRYIEAAKKETLDSLYKDVKSIWKKYVDADDYHNVIGAADTVFTYFQDRIGMTHYLLFVGDNSVGKTNRLTVFQQLAYRAQCDVSITPANIYRFLGSIEEGQGVILEDEIDNIDEQAEKMKIYKSGYITGKKVTRNDDTSSGRKSQAYCTYCFKAFTSEKQPDSIKGKGFNERTFLVKCSAGSPEYDISEVVNPAGDETYELLLDELVCMRKRLIIYRLLHCNDPLPDVGLSIKNRDKQLCKPLIRLFQGTEAVKEILECLRRLLIEKKERKANTLDARVYNIVTSLVEKEGQVSFDEDEVVLGSVTIWDAVTTEIEGEPIPDKKQSWDTVEYGKISRKMIASILEDKFKAERPRDPKVRKFKFSRKKLKRLGSNYSSIDKIEIIPRTKEKKDDKDHSASAKHDTYDTSDASTESKSVCGGSTNVQSRNNCTATLKDTRENRENRENIAKVLTPSRDSVSSNESVSSPDVSQVSEASMKSNCSDPPKSFASDTTDELTLPSYVHRLGRSDIFACEYCRLKDDRWGMMKHHHPTAAAAAG